MASSATRTMVMTGGVAAIVAVGAYTGASMGVDKDKKKAQQKVVYAPASQQIEQLENLKARLLTQRRGLEKKLSELDERRAAKQSPES